MDLSNPTQENVMYMIEQIKEKVRMVNVDAMQSDKFDEEKYKKQLTLELNKEKAEKLRKEMKQ